jgi:hypothetical protein
MRRRPLPVVSLKYTKVVHLGWLGDIQDGSYRVPDMIDSYFAESLAISLGVEDFHGLYELVWSLNRLRESEPPEERLRAAQSALQALVERSLIAVYSAERAHESAEPPIAATLAREVISDPQAWLSFDDRGAPYHHFATTAEGERLRPGGVCPRCLLRLNSIRWVVTGLTAA